MLDWYNNDSKLTRNSVILNRYLLIFYSTIRQPLTIL